MKKKIVGVVIILGAFAILFLIHRYAGERVPPMVLPEVDLREAMFYEKMEGNQVWCQLCPRKCIIPEGMRGFCRVRENRGGKLYSLVYGKPCSLPPVEPIEKAPFYHFNPGHRRLCVATVSCNLRCKYCQNWHISQVSPEDVVPYSFPPEKLVEKAIEEEVESICFTFTEPVVFYEYVYDTAKIAREKGLKVSIVSAGYICEEPLRELVKVLDAVKIDLKAYTESFYRRMCQGELKPILRTLEILKEEGIHFEIVNLIIPTLNDEPQKIREMCQWIKENLGEDIPLHFIRFFPAYKLTHLRATPISTLEMAFNIAKEIGLNYVYVGNVPSHEHNSTFCPNCGKRLIYRIGFQVIENNIEDGRCKFWGQEVRGVWR